MKSEILGKSFCLDGEPYQLISGAIHYFRIVPEYWRDRLLKLRAMGANAVETYIPWNMHEREQGEFTFEGRLDVGRFIETAREVGLNVILRPSPYICAEWEFGGLPYWLLRDDGMQVRSMYEPYLDAVKAYYDVLMPYLRPYMCTEGGPVIMMQIENEYGYYGDCHEYMEWMRDLIRSYGIEVPLFTSDGPYEDAFKRGKVDGVLQTGNFGSHAEERFDFMKQYVDGPLTCMEFWLGWFDDWGSEIHHTTSCEQNTRDFAYMLDHGNVNIYMFIGGTDFGFMNGSNYYECLKPDVTSYDYDALLTEDGRLTEKYESFRREIAKRKGVPEVSLPAEIRRRAYGEFGVTGYVSLWDALGDIATVHRSEKPVNMEKLGQGYGYVLYRTTVQDGMAVSSAADVSSERTCVSVSGDGTDVQEISTGEQHVSRSMLQLTDTADRAKLYVDRHEVMTLYDTELEEAHETEAPLTGELDILVENMGRVNFGDRMNSQRKGIAGEVLVGAVSEAEDSEGCYAAVGYKALRGFEIYSLPLESVKGLRFTDVSDATKGEGCSTNETCCGNCANEIVGDGPAFYHFDVDIDEPADTFIDMSGWGKGCVFVNDFNIGRFWNVGPQRTLYIPGPLMKSGHNEIVIFETEGVAGGRINLTDESNLGPEADR